MTGTRNAEIGFLLATGCVFVCGVAEVLSVPITLLRLCERVGEFARLGATKISTNMHRNEGQARLLHVVLLHVLARAK